MTNIPENVVLTITRKPSIYLGPRYSRHSNRYNKNNYINNNINNNNKENEMIIRKKRMLEWYELDDERSSYIFSDYCEYLNGASIETIDQNVIKRKAWQKYEEEFDHLEEIERMNSVRDIEDNKIYITTFVLSNIDDYDEPWNLNKKDKKNRVSDDNTDYSDFDEDLEDTFLSDSGEDSDY